MAEGRAVWEVHLGGRVVGYVGWLGGARLLVDLERQVGRLVQAWFADAMAGVEAPIPLASVDAVLAGAVAPRLGGRLVQVDPDTLPARVWLRFVDGERIVRGVRDPTGYRSNRFSWPIDPTELLDGTVDGRTRWARGLHGSFKAGGRAADDEVWLALGRDGPRSTLVIRRNHALEDAPIVQVNGWFHKSVLHRLAVWLDRRLPG